ncbi:MAG: tetratricopeptide repeat protein, partial [Candidatus Omnitrophica bacterium]|nr:tetratricopeptide repeat protein [Candidatus Omnitrophota bacterium]
LYLKKHDLEKALIYLKQAEDLNPYDIDVLISLSLISSQQGQNEKAAEYLERVLRLEPKHKFAYHALKNLDKN